MISNYHTASNQPGTYYMSGFDDNVPKQKGPPKQSHRRKLGSRFFSRKRSNSADTTSDNSNGADSMTYSTGSSVQSPGQSTDSSQFSEIMKVLDIQDSEELARLEAKFAKDSKMLTRGASVASQISGASSLQYSTDGEHSLLRGSRILEKSNSNSNLSNTSSNYSTDAESQLEGSKILQSLINDGNPSNGRLVDELKNSPIVEDEDPFDIACEPAASPSYQRKKKERNGYTSHQPAGADSVSKSPSYTSMGNQSKESNRSSRISVHSYTTDATDNTGKSPNADKPTKYPNKCAELLLEEYLPESRKTLEKLKTILRPYLCGVI